MRKVLAAALTALFVLIAIPAAHADDEIWKTLRNQNGLTVLYRHALAPGGGDPANFRLGDCSTQRNLSNEGRQQARAMGRELRTNRIPIASVRSSRWCRAEETARLMNIGVVRPTPALDSVFTASAQKATQQERRTRQIIAAHRGKPGVLVLVGHQANIIDLTGVAPDSGEGVVVRADDRGELTVIGRIPPP